LHGHIHPAVKLRGKGRQRLKLPCFFFAKDYGVMPSFGDFTGSFALSPTGSDQVYAIAENQVLKIS
jgi:metallophosphoesterase superfamily enzyme